MVQVAVTVAGQYAGAPAFEYELRGEAGELLAVDFVVVHALPGEGAAELEALVGAFLERRLAKWQATPVGERERRREVRLGGRRLGPDGIGERGVVLERR